LNNLRCNAVHAAKGSHLNPSIIEFDPNMTQFKLHARIFCVGLGDDPLWPMLRARDQAIRLNRLSQNRLRLPMAPTIMP